MIDFVIPSHPKDFASLKIAIHGIKNISCANRIFVICMEDPKIKDVIHIPEKRFFKYIDKEKIDQKYRDNAPHLIKRSKWIYQQFLKLYSSKVIPELTDSYVLTDSDTIFVRDVNFDIEKFYYVKNKIEYHKPYLEPIKALLGVEDTIGFSTISHHMIFNKKMLEEMYSFITNRFESDSLFDIIIDILDYTEASCLSEWDLYANYMILNHPEMCQHRDLRWEDISFIPVKSHFDDLKDDYDFVCCHAYRRGLE